MTDIFDKKTRSKIMSSIRSKHTKPELMLKKELRKHGFSYQPQLFGKPDFANRRKKIAIFVDGCFWHKCPKCYQEPASRRRYWLPKIENNTKRDRKVNKTLKKAGWTVLRVWEHEVKKNPAKLLKKCLTR